MHLIAMTRISVLVAGVSLLLGCSTFSNQPTQDMVEAQLRKTRKIVRITSVLPPSTIVDRTLKSGCGPEVKTTSSLVMPGPGVFVPVVSKGTFSVDHGSWPDGSTWMALRMDGMAHAVPAGMKIVPRADGGSDISVLAADSRKSETIQSRVEDGTLFCHWREFGYPYD